MDFSRAPFSFLPSPFPSPEVSGHAAGTGQLWRASDASRYLEQH